MVAWEHCPWCIKASALFEELGADVHVMYCERDTQELQEAKDRNNWLSVPMITHVSVHGDDIKETFIGGYDNLCRLIGRDANDSQGG
jgi:glutaredoxin